MVKYIYIYIINYNSVYIYIYIYIYTIIIYWISEARRLHIWKISNKVLLHVAFSSATCVAEIFERNAHELHACLTFFSKLHAWQKKLLRNSNVT